MTSIDEAVDAIVSAVVGVAIFDILLDSFMERSKWGYSGRYYVHDRDSLLREWREEREWRYIESIERGDEDG